MYQHAVENPTSAMAVFVTHLPPHDFFTEAALVSSPQGEPSHAGWDFFAVAVFLSIFLLGMVVGIYSLPYRSVDFQAGREVAVCRCR